MQINQKPISDCTPAELRTFAVDRLGLEIAKTSTGDQIIAKLRTAGWTQDHIDIASDAGAPSVQDNPGTAAPAPMSGVKVDENGRTYYRITIPEQDKPGGSEPVFVSVNGRAMFIPRNKPEWVPAEYVEALSHAEEFHYDTRDDGLGLKPPRVVKSYPFQISAS